jgi:hypothetical protein
MKENYFLLVVVGIPILLAIIRAVWGDGKSNRPKW